LCTEDCRRQFCAIKLNDHSRHWKHGLHKDTKLDLWHWVTKCSWIVSFGTPCFEKKLTKRNPAWISQEKFGITHQYVCNTTELLHSVATGLLDAQEDTTIVWLQACWIAQEDTTWQNKHNRKYKIQRKFTKSLVEWLKIVRRISFSVLLLL